MNQSSSGFALLQASIICLVVVIGESGALVYSHNHTKNKSPQQSSVGTTSSTPSPTPSTSQAADPYAGWKSSTSPRAKFSIKYPADWVYSEQVGSKDDVEHITITGSKLALNINSFNSNNSANPAITYTTCTDCQSTVNTQAFTVSKLGALNLETVTYTLDGGIGNALILSQPNGIYYIPSPTASDVVTSFRGISVLNSEQAYQRETQAQFAANPDFTTAQLILKSVSY